LNIPATGRPNILVGTQLGHLTAQNMEREEQPFSRLVTKASLACLLVALLTTAAAAQPPPKPTPLPADDVVRQMVTRNLERANALRAFEATRTYRLQYQGFPSDRDAEIVVTVLYRAPDSKQFTIVSQSGSKLIINRVFRKLLDSENEAMQAENRARTALNTDNYNFALTGFEPSAQSYNYVFEVEPKNPTKFVYRGKIWVDAKDFAVTKMQVEPAKSPSFWTKRSEIQHTYMKVDGFWLPQQNRSVSTIRLGGQAVLTIDYGSYKIRDPISAASSRELTPLTPASR
jgi:outer membrane lipoprotein-sorting protein